MNQLKKIHEYLMNRETMIQSSSLKAKRILLAVLLLLPALLFLFNACRSERPPGQLEFWTIQLRPQFDAYMQELIRQYESENPAITIRWIDVPFEAINQKFMAAIAAKEPPDIINLSGDYLAQFIAMKVLTDLDTLIATEDREAYLPAAWEAGQGIDGGSYALPWYLATYITIYNRRLFEEAGLTENDIPRTYDELLQLARTYKERSGKFLFFFNMGEESYLHFVLGSEGLSVLTPDRRRAALNSAEVVAALRPWVQLYRDGYLPRESIMEGHRQAIQLYSSGQVALISGGAQFLKIIQENAPNIYNHTDVAPAILGEAGKHNMAPMMVSIPRASLNKQSALDFALYLTNARNQLEFCRQVPILPSIRAALADSFFVRVEDDPESKARSIAAAQLPQARVLQPPVPNTVRLYRVFGEAIQKACLGDKSLQEALDETAAIWNSVLSKEGY
jgi:putative chitobiose transport system substrate-binding protein